MKKPPWLIITAQSVDGILAGGFFGGNEAANQGQDNAEHDEHTGGAGGQEGADALLAGYDYGTWYLMGHSLGGLTAAGYAAENGDRIDGLILSPNVKLDSVETLDVDFANSDHNPVRIEVSLLSE